MKVGRHSDPPDVVGRAAALAEALQAGRSHLPRGPVGRAETVLRRVDERLNLTGGHTVVALAGATGSGKSSLFNHIAGIDLAAVGVRRPTTLETEACIWGTQGTSALMDWLNLPTRHRITRESALDLGRESELQGLVLLDLPDFDSTMLDHRLEVERLLGLADVFIWITDPQKYADAALHERYLRPMAGHDGVTVVVLNHADRLAREEIDECRRDLERLLREDGLDGQKVLVTSALTGAGVPQLRALISGAVKSGATVRERLGADLDGVVSSLSSSVAESEAPAELPGAPALVQALGQAAGVPPVLDAVEEDYRRSAAVAGGWPVTRWLGQFRPDPLRRLHLGADAGAEPEAGGESGAGAGSGAAGERGRGRHESSGSVSESPDELEAALRHSSGPTPTPAQRTRVVLASRQLANEAAQGLPSSWANAVHDAAVPPGDEVADALDRAVLGTDLSLDRPRWWAVMGLVQWTLTTLALLGLVWLIALGIFGALHVPHVHMTDLLGLPVPTALFVGGLVLGFLVGIVVRVVARARARRRRRRVAGELEATIAAVAQEQIVQPVREVLAAHRRTREALEQARG